MGKHTSIQLKKARRAFMGARHLFYSKHINKRVKIIAYKSLIRPILTYGCQVWFNQVPHYMERYRVFERKCLRHCNGIFRKAETNFTHFVSNKIQYENYDSDRIDNHIIKLTRDHINRATTLKKHTQNSLIYGPYLVDTILAKHYASKGLVPGPNMFIHYDRLGYIQNSNAIPIIYHVQRRPNEKWFDEDKFKNSDEHIRYNTTTGEMMDPDTQAEKCQKYWWLHNIENDDDQQQQ